MANRRRWIQAGITVTAELRGCREVTDGVRARRASSALTTWAESLLDS
jgi:hypothetical protein